MKAIPVLSLSLCLLAAAPALPAADAVRATSASTADNAIDAQRLAALDARIEAVRQQFDVPGIAIAIVLDGEVVIERGYGLREIGKPGPVDAHTLFAIASNTKAFTATALQLLAEDGKLDMDDRVIDHLPWFRMGDAYVTREMRIRDLLAHRSGLSLGAGDLLFWPPSDYSSREVVERLAHVPVTGQFRGQYAYDNVLYAVAQLVIEEASGMTFKAFLQTRIFNPLGMSETRHNADQLLPGDKVATGHAKPDFGNTLVSVGTLSWENVAGAGGLYSSVHDLSKWMKVQLAGGVISGAGENAVRLFPAKRQRQMWTMLTPIPVSTPSVPELAPMMPNFLGYGEGWMLSDYRGEKLVWHTGGWPGQVSRLTLVPGKKLGIVVLTNQEVGAAFNAVTYEALDVMLGREAYDWIDAYGKAVAKADAGADDSWAKLQAARDAKSKPSLPLARYAGTWRDPWYGDVRISHDGKGLAMQFSRTPALNGRLEHWQHDSFIVRWQDRTLNADSFVYFALEPDGSIREMRMKPVSPKTDFSFDFQDLRLLRVEPTASASK